MYFHQRCKKIQFTRSRASDKMEKYDVPLVGYNLLADSHQLLRTAFVLLIDVTSALSGHVTT